VIVSLRDRSEEGRRRDIGLMVATGLSMVPAAALGRVKVGGDLNSHTPVLYFLLPAVALVVVRLRSTVVRDGILAAVLLGGFLQQRGNVDLLFRAAIRPESGASMAFEYLREHPDRAYFPWHPLSALMANGRRTPFAHGVADLVLAGHAPTREAFERALPPAFEWVCFDERFEPCRQEILDYLPGFTRAQAPRGLEGWTVYRRAASEIHPR
jgi:hypothetical protein